jgi:NADH:ubiquinone oxidoreductase subunit E
MLIHCFHPMHWPPYVARWNGTLASPVHYCQSCTMCRIAGRVVVQVCRAESCQAVGADALMAHAEKVLGCASHHTRADGAYTLEPVYCLGMCALSPAIMVGEKLHARMTPEKFDRILAPLKAQA